MSLSNTVIKVIGIALALVGFGLLLSAVGISFFGIVIHPVWLALLLGVLFLGAGIHIVGGGTVSI